MKNWQKTGGKGKNRKSHKKRSARTQDRSRKALKTGQSKKWGMRAHNLRTVNGYRRKTRGCKGMSGGVITKKKKECDQKRGAKGESKKCTTRHHGGKH